MVLYGCKKKEAKPQGDINYEKLKNHYIKRQTSTSY